MADQAILASATISSEPTQVQEEVLALSFDLYERYDAFRRIVREFFPQPGDVTILDVGANSPHLWPGFSSLVQTFLPEARCVVADLQITKGLQNAVSASGLALPFQDNSFDVVSALDTLEHVPDGDRGAFIDELLRVSRDLVYLTFPYSSPGNMQAERLVSTYVDDVLQSPLYQLHEHRELGLPDLASVDQTMVGRNVAVSTVGHGNVDIWLLMMLASHSLRVRSIDELFELSLRFNRDCAARDWVGPSYRTSYVLSKARSKADLDLVWLAVKEQERGDLQLSEVLALVRSFAEAEITPQIIWDKDRHIENLETIRDALVKAAEERQNHIDQLLPQLRARERQIADLESSQRTLERAIEDKERHIINLEAELAAVRRQAAITAELQVRMQNLEQTMKDTVEELQQGLRERHASLEAEDKALAQGLASGTQELERLIRGAIQAQEAVAKNLDRRVSAQELFAQQLVTGRTWRTLQAFGNLAKIVLPNRTPAAQPVPPVPKPALASPVPNQDSGRGVHVPEGSRREPEVPSHQTAELAQGDGRELHDEVHFVCDEPLRDDKRPRNRNLIIRGWALGTEPFDCVEVTIAGLRTERIPVNIPRPDVKHAFPELDKSGRTGFSGSIDTQSLADGRHSAQLRLITQDRVIREIEAEFLIDHSVGYASDYEEWIADFERPADEILLLKLPRITRSPLISIIMPVFNTEPAELSMALDSLLAQSYPEWELCIADDGSTRPEVKEILSEYASRSARIKIVYQEERRGIAAALNAGLQLAAGEYIALMDHDDTLSPHALAYVVEAIEQQPEADLIYSDEDKLDEHGQRYQPFFKPDWSPDLILCTNYICHLTVISKALVEKVGTFSSETDGSQDYEYILRASAKAQQILHIPRILYHWRAGPNSTAYSIESKPYAIDASRRTLERFCSCEGKGARIEPGMLPGTWRIRYPIPAGSRVSIIIAAGGNAQVLQTNLKSVFGKTEYSDFEVVVIDNSRGSAIREAVTAFSSAGHAIRYLDYRDQPFNYSRINNIAARDCQSPILLFLNDDVSVISSEWLTSMVELIARPEVGAVGAKLFFPNGAIQHAGVVMGLFQNCGHAFYGLSGDTLHYFGFADLIRNVSAVTGACLMTKAEVFWKAGGFDEEKLAVAFNDIDLCLKIGSAGYRVLFTPFAQLYHHEAFSKTRKDLIPHPTEVAVMRSKWKQVIAADPYYNPNLTREKANYSLPTLWT